MWDSNYLISHFKVLILKIVTSWISLCINCRQKNPTILLAAISTTDVGVATFSLIRNNKVSMEKE